jgi:hypothetical protein
MAKTDEVHTIRRGEYAFAVEECALPVILLARGIGCTTGEHLARFLNAVGVNAPNGGVSAKVSSGKWTKTSANRAVQHLARKKLITWSRHRGKRNPTMEALRLDLFETAVKVCREAEGYGMKKQSAA